jgi:hypothetical protein
LQKIGYKVCEFQSPVYPKMIFCLALQDFTAGEIFPPTLTLPLRGGEGGVGVMFLKKCMQRLG